MPASTATTGSAQAAPTAIATEPAPAVTEPPVAATDMPSSPEAEASPTAGRQVAGTVVKAIPVGVEPMMLAAGEGGIWVPNIQDGTLNRIDPATDDVIATIEVGDPSGGSIPGTPKSVVVGDGFVWVTVNSEENIAQIDPATNEIVGTIAIGAEPHMLAFSPGSVWVSTGLSASVVRVDTTTKTAVATIPVDPTPFGIAATEDAVWVVSRGAQSSVTRIDPATNEVVATIELEWPDGPTPDPGCGYCPTFVMADENGVWVSMVLGGVARIDPATNEIVTVIPVDAPAGMVSDEQGVWLAQMADPSVLLIDPGSNQVVGEIAMLPQLMGITLYEGELWASAIASQQVYRIDPMD
jgi:streptogramin lyase